MQFSGALQLVFVGAVLVIVLLQLLFRKELGLWALSITSNAGVPFGFILRMRMRGRDPEPIVLGAVKSRYAGLKVQYQELERHAAAGGSVDSVVRSLIMAAGANVPFHFAEAAKMDLEGSDAAAWIEDQARRQEKREVPNGVRWLMERQEAKSAPPSSVVKAVLSPVRLLIVAVTLPVRILLAHHRAKRASLPLRSGELLCLGWNGVDPRLVVATAIRLREAGVDVEFDKLHTIKFIGGDLKRIAGTLIAAKLQGFEIDFDTAASLDLGGEDPMSLFEAMTAAREGGWELRWEDAAEMVYAGQDPVEFVKRALAGRAEVTV